MRKNDKEVWIDVDEMMEELDEFEIVVDEASVEIVVDEENKIVYLLGRKDNVDRSGETQ